MNLLPIIFLFFHNESYLPESIFAYPIISNFLARYNPQCTNLLWLNFASWKFIALYLMLLLILFVVAHYPFWGWWWYFCMHFATLPTLTPLILAMHNKQVQILLPIFKILHFCRLKYCYCIKYLHIQSCHSKLLHPRYDVLISRNTDLQYDQPFKMSLF